MEFTGLQNSIIRLRPLEPVDLQLLYIWENDTDTWKFGDTVSPYSKITLESFIETSNFDVTINKQLRLIIEEISSEKAVGVIDLYDVNFIHGRAGVGILIDKNFRKRGYAFEALQLISGYAFGILNLTQLYCYIREDNEESIQLFNKAGFQKSGLLVDWVKESGVSKNTIILQKLIIS
ncbi:MAG: GNAT family N-acetyltransferase [Bacteroidetes bacterium HGW-Bacteroidetes-21]|jgi:diamine N-acetyltransferase|nr:MAG: GNAT family N-acetyltransferase [Bacteroidetes bacterium HGW-Bacteroidetes-21]